MSRIATIIAVLGVAVFLTATPSSARLADNSASFADPVGDAVAGGADITNVSISNDAKGFITIVVRIPNRPSFTPDTGLWIAFDTEYNGPLASGGFDHWVWIQYDPDPEATFYRPYTEKTLVSAWVPSSWMTFTWANGLVTVGLDSRLLAVLSQSDFQEVPGRQGEWLASRFSPPETFTFKAHSFRIVEEYPYERLADTAPDGSGSWPYEVKILRDLILKEFWAPKSVKAGDPLTVRMTVVRDVDQQVVTAKPTCRARIGKRILLLWNPPVAAEAARPSTTCSWRVFKDAKGKTVTGSITLTDSSGLHPVVESKSFSVKVK